MERLRLANERVHHSQLSVDDGIRYRRTVDDADLFGGGVVSETTRLCEECGLQYLHVSLYGSSIKEALLLVTFNPSVLSGARAEPWELLGKKESQVITEYLAAGRK